MLKTKISIGKSIEDNGLSIYDHFGDPEMEEKFVHIMARCKERFYVFMVKKYRY